MLGQGEGDTFLQLELQEEDSDDDFQINENAASISQPPLLFLWSLFWWKSGILGMSLKPIRFLFVQVYGVIFFKIVSTVKPPEQHDINTNFIGAFSINKKNIFKIPYIGRVLLGV
jgi:hypothetical protein